MEKNKQIERISVKDAQVALEDRDTDALLVCAYADESKCEKFRLNGSLTMGEFRRREPSLDSGQTVIFYCN